MADVIWQSGGVDVGDYSENANWLGGVPAADGDTIYLFPGVTTFPNKNQLGAGTLHFNINIEATLTLEDFLYGASIGNVVIDCAAALVYVFGAGTLTATTGDVYMQGTYTTVTGNGGTLHPSGTITGAFVATDDTSIVWGGAAWSGSFNADANTITHSTDTTASITLTETADFDLGGTFDGSLTVNGNGKTVTATAAITAGSFTLTLGTYNDGGFPHLFAESITISGGTFTNTGTWTKTGDSGTVENATYTRSFTDLAVAGGVTMEMSDDVYMASLSLGDGAAVTGSLGTEILQLIKQNGSGPSSDGYWTQPSDATVSVPVRIWKCSKAPGSNIALTNKNLTVETNGENAITMDGNISLGTGNLYVRGTGTDNSQTLDMAGYNLTCGAVSLGAIAANTGKGVLYLGEGTHSIASLADGDGDTATNELYFESSSVSLSGTLDGDNITTTSAGANLHGGTIQNVTSTGVIHCWGVTDGGSNSADVCHEGSNVSAAVGGMHSGIGAAA